MQLNDEKRTKILIKAEKLAENFDPKEAEEFAKKYTNASWYDDFKLLYDMIIDSEFRLEPSTYLSIAGALAYVVFPLDIIPDFIPGIGFIDDVFVVGFVMKSLSDEINRYRLHKEAVS